MSSVSKYLAENIAHLRKKKGLSQGQLAKLAELPRSTLTHMESGSGNPSLQNLIRLSGALQIGIEELLARPRNEIELRNADEIPVQKRGRVRVVKLLPEKAKGLDVDKMEFETGAVLAGRPHVTGAKEYLTVIKGELTVAVAGEIFQVKTGGVLAFPGDQAHSYRNAGSAQAVAISVVVPVTLRVD